MVSLNLRQKIVGCFCLYLLFHMIVGIIFLKDFELFKNDVVHLMHASNLSNLSLEIRRYEKNYLSWQNTQYYTKVLDYIDKAEKSVAQIINDVKVIAHPVHLHDFTVKLSAYKHSFQAIKKNCADKTNSDNCPELSKVRTLGQEIVTITENLVKFEQQNMNEFIQKFYNRLVEAIIFLFLLSILTGIILYTSIVTPLRMVEKAAIGVRNGTFSLLPVEKEKGEVKRVLQAFNKMVTDLDEHQKQLFQAKKLSSIGTLASGTAHQINNPLNNISTSCQLALAEIDTRQNPFIVKMLNTINQETQRAGEIVRGLLEFSRTQSFSLQPCLLFTVVNKVTQLVASEIPAGIVLQTDIPHDISVLIDIQKMIEALLNLTINAIQAIPAPPGTVYIYAEKDTEEKNAVITVADTGTGIEKVHLQEIFDPFFTTKNAEEGTGLGLAVVYGIVKKHKGSIRVESEVGQGTRFITELPLFIDTDNADHSSMS